MNLTDMGISELRGKIQSKEVTAVQVVESFLDRIKILNKSLNAFITLNEKALEEADKIDKKISKGEKVGDLAGMPIAVKDMLCTKGIKTTAASKILNNFINFLYKNIVI